jgi:methanogenic corrinoid protein MtbC1
MSNKRFGEIYSIEPRYNTKAVVRETGVPADTFRAWERRYGVPMPHRTATSQRLYSERDIAIIRWLRDRTAEGLTISQAVRLLEQAGGDEGSETRPLTWEYLRQQLGAALLRLDASSAETVLGQAFALYSLDDVCVKLLSTALVEIGEGWHAGTVSIGQEHFATQFIRRKLQGLLAIYDVAAGHATIVAACAPGEQHDVGLLILSLILVRRGYRVVYLGPDVPLEGLLPVVKQAHPEVVCLSTTTAATAGAVREIAEAVRKLDHPPVVVAGGGGIGDVEDGAPYVRMDGDALAAVEQIGALIAARRSADGRE